MGRALLTAYFAVFYSIGVASLIYASILRLAADEPHLGRFLACTASMTAIVLSSAALNAYGDGMGIELQTMLRLGNRSVAALYAYLLVAFAAEVRPFRGDALAKRLAAFLAAVGFVFGAAGIILSDREWMGFVTLAVKDAAILGAMAIALVPRKAADRESDGTYRFFFRIVSVATAFLMPFILFEEVAGLLGASPFSAKGSISLPAVYGVWSAVFIAAHLRRGRAVAVRAAGPAMPDGAFSARYGITQRESEILGLLLSGLSYKRIMSELSISMPTVKSHVSSLYRKTGTANRLELAAKAAAESAHTKG